MKNHLSSLESLRKAAQAADIQPGQSSWQTLESMLLENKTRGRNRVYSKIAVAAVAVTIFAFVGWNIDRNTGFTGLFQHQQGLILTNLDDEPVQSSGPQLYQSSEMNKLREAYALLAAKAFTRE